MRRKKIMERQEKDIYYLDIALKVAARSTCLKRKYGCIIVKNDEIIATGYNGSSRGEENCCDNGKCKRKDSERYTGYESCPAVHAEQNAMLEVSRKDMIGATLYLACEEYQSTCADTKDNCISCQSMCSYKNNIWKEDLSPAHLVFRSLRNLFLQQ